jgi:hypothetical protein
LSCLTFPFLWFHKFLHRHFSTLNELFRPSAIPSSRFSDFTPPFRTFCEVLIARLPRSTSFCMTTLSKSFRSWWEGVGGSAVTARVGVNEEKIGWQNEKEEGQ